jgi:N-acylneuraminate cytidylyltransferase
MIDGKTVLAIIPARGGSKGVPRKNIREILGKPLIAWTIEAAKKSKYIDRLILSSDDSTIIEIAEQWGCDVPFIRPKELAEDDTPGILPVLHALEQLPGYDYCVLLQPTSPLRITEDIDGCIELCVNRAATACISVSEATQNPYWMHTITEDGKLHKFIKGIEIDKRQDIPQLYAENGAVMMADIKWLIQKKTFFSDETLAYVMPRLRSLDVDTEEDFVLSELLLERQLKELHQI